MFLLDQIFFSHALDRIVLLIFFVLTQHDFSKSPSAQNFEKLELFKVVNVILIAFAFEDDFAFSFNLLILFQTLSIEKKRLNGVYFFDSFVDFIDRVCVRLE